LILLNECGSRSSVNFFFRARGVNFFLDARVDFLFRVVNFFLGTRVTEFPFKKGDVIVAVKGDDTIFAYPFPNDKHIDSKIIDIEPGFRAVFVQLELNERATIGESPDDSEEFWTAIIVANGQLFEIEDYESPDQILEYWKKL